MAAFAAAFIVALGVMWPGSLARRPSDLEPSAYSSPHREAPVTPGMKRFLASDAARAACCSPQKYWDAAVRHESLAAALPPSERVALEHLRAAAYLYFLAGSPEKARLSMIRVAESAREYGATLVASSAYLEAARIAIWAERTSDSEARRPNR